MYDMLIKFSSEAEAQADPVIGAYWLPGDSETPAAWRGDVCLSGVKAWRASLDVTTTDADGNLVVTHSYEPYFYILLSLPHVDAAIEAMPNCMLIADREAMKRGDPFVVYTPVPSAQLPDFRVEPTFADIASYPFGSPR